ncbi:MAG TPA: hypothetical protein VJP88_04600 [Caulobacteraceae bacterium]|nr:hypothetical protein [Caulobacteraceae bacterium]
MQALKSVPGVRSLKSITTAASSARVLDLHGLAAEASGELDYAEKPLFQHPILNRTIILKHNVRSSEEDRLAPRRFNATKIIFPFDPTDLNLGGQYMFVEQAEFVAVLTRHLDYRDLDPSRDIAVLRVLDRLPTLDPFLVREILAQQRMDVARCYYRFSKTDRQEMLGFVAHEIAALIQLCFGETDRNAERARRLSQILLADQDSPELEPLRQTLRMDADEFLEAMFAWKAFLYYRWRAQALAPQLKATLRALASIRQRQFERDELSFVMAARQLLERTIATALQEVSFRLKAYDRAFGSLTNRDNPESFRHFLIHGANLFIELGERIGRLDQIVSFWADRFGHERVAAMAPDDVLEGTRDLLHALSIWPAGIDDDRDNSIAPARSYDPFDDEFAGMIP